MQNFLSERKSSFLELTSLTELSFVLKRNQNQVEILLSLSFKCVIDTNIATVTL